MSILTITGLIILFALGAACIDWETSGRKPRVKARKPRKAKKSTGKTQGQPRRANGHWDFKVQPKPVQTKGKWVKVADNKYIVVYPNRNETYL